MKILKKIFLCFLIGFALLLSGLFLWMSDKYVVPVVMYHHVAPGSNDRADTVSPETFYKHLEYLSKNGFDVLTLDEYVTRKKNNEEFSHKSVVITFDDGYVDNYTYAYKELVKYNFPATFFLPSQLMGLRDTHLTWDQIREMTQNQMSIGGHGHTHKYLPELTEEQQRFEITESKKILEEQTGVSVNHFAYPIGGFNDSIKKMVEQAGYISAVATNRGTDRFNYDLFEINRVRLSDDDTHAIDMWVKFSGYYNLFRKMKNPY